jgi:hypothetical protein
MIVALSSIYRRATIYKYLHKRERAARAERATQYQLVGFASGARLAANFTPVNSALESVEQRRKILSRSSACSLARAEIFSHFTDVDRVDLSL